MRRDAQGSPADSACGGRGPGDAKGGRAWALHTTGAPREGSAGGGNPLPLLLPPAAPW
jgi:hypothetical protein